MEISANIIADSVNEEGIRITTFLLKYPRFILPELNTHRVFSRNTASSRAVPTKKMLQKVREEPATFSFFGKNQPGMQAFEEMSLEEREFFEKWWFRVGKLVADEVESLTEEMKERFGTQPHKQMINRAIEPWLTVQTVLTATEFDNFFELRLHKDAQPEIKELASKMFSALNRSEPVFRETGEWHIPFIREDEKDLDIETKLKISTARCARTSYFYHDGSNSTIEKDIELHDRLVGAKPIHASPTEHQAFSTGDRRFHKNFRGWKQYRFIVEKRVK